MKSFQAIKFQFLKWENFNISNPEPEMNSLRFGAQLGEIGEELVRFRYFGGAVDDVEFLRGRFVLVSLPFELDQVLILDQTPSANEEDDRLRDWLLGARLALGGTHYFRVQILVVVRVAREHYVQRTSRRHLVFLTRNRLI